MEIYQKREFWYLKEEGKDIKTFSSKEEAEAAAGINCEDCECDPCECDEETLDGGEEEEEGHEEETSTDK